MDLTTSELSEHSITAASTLSAAMEHQGTLFDYGTMITHLDTPNISLAVLQSIRIVPHAYSPLAGLGAPGQKLLEPLVKNPEYRAHCQQSGANPDTLVLTVDGNKVKYEATSEDGTRTVILGLPTKQELIDLMPAINLAAVKLGGVIRSDGAIKLVQMINYYGILPWNPKDTTEHRATIHNLEEKRARHSLQLGIGVDIDACPRTPNQHDKKTLKAIQRVKPTFTMDNLTSQLTNSKITDIVKQFLPKTESSLFHHLEKNTSPRATADKVRTTPTVVLEDILRSPESERLGNALLEGLNWYGGQPDEDASAEVRIKLISKAIRLWTNMSSNDSPEDIAGYPWHKRSNWGKSYPRIWAEFERHLFDSKRASSMTEARLLARLFQSEFPREFQISDTPADLPYSSSVVWVNFVHGVLIAEAMEPDLLQRMTFQQLVDLPLQRSMQATAEELELIALARIPPTLEWAITNDVIFERADSDYSQEEIERSVKALDEHTDALRKAIIQLDVMHPERSAITEREMKAYFGGEHPISSATIFGETRTVSGNINTSSAFTSDGRKLIEDFGPIGGGRPTRPLADKVYSFKDVYMSWKWTKNKTWFITTSDGVSRSKHRISFNADRTIKTTAHWLPETLTRNPLPDIEKIFESEFNNYLTLTKSAYQTLLKSQFFSLPYDDRQAIEKGEIKMFTLRKPTDEIGKANETAEITLPLRLRMGFILQVDYKTKISYYECLPKAGIIRERTDVSASMLGGKEEKEQIEGSFVPDVPVVRGKSVPFDWDAHETGTPPKKNATCTAIIDQFGETFSAPSPSPDSEYSSSGVSGFSQALKLADYIAHHFFYYDEKQFYAVARGTTEIEKVKNRPYFTQRIKDFIPFFGSISDLLSNDPNKQLWGFYGLFFDVASFAFPVGKFTSGSMKLASTTVRSGIRAALPEFRMLVTKLSISLVQNTIPFYGLPTLGLRLLRGALRGLYTGFKSLLRPAYKSIQNAAGRAGRYSVISGLPQIDPGRWTPLTNSDRLATLRGLPDVPVRNVGSPTRSAHYLIDPLSGKPYGRRLKVSESELSIGPSLYPTVGKNSDSVLCNIPENTRVREMPEVDGRTTMYLDDVAYRLDGNILRRVSLIDDSEALKLVPCRLTRVIAETVCINSFVSTTPAPTPSIGSIDETKGYALWFGDQLSTPQTWHQNQYLTRDGGLYRITNNVPRRVHDDLRTLGFSQNYLVPRRTITATIEFRKGIYARINIPGTYEQATDIQRVAAVVVPAIDDTAIHVFTRVNTDKYYLATVPKGNSLSEPLKFKRLTPAEMADDMLGGELSRVYTGSLNANNTARLHGVEAVERAMRTMEDIAIPLGTAADPARNMRWLKVDTSPGEALMFDHSTRMIVTSLPEGAATWTRSGVASQPFRQKTAEILDTLFLSPIIKPRLADPYLRIQDTMSRLHHLLPRYARPVNARNIAFADVTTTSGQREIYVSVSGAQGSTLFAVVSELGCQSGTAG
ncbi:hypothetical protein PS862_02063 [Pseudomonas fluorescens]|uniref:Uncharacterized protein n=1 Tax=Pseudomonas fluorescens TaxID=294 RepID=A0A5E7JA79_PSEFL|nr:hypothetical protein [Pseudomonas fluorescens]VVO85585.1 hypothetical protein PS862_02063 [Pseudomonas fluorescens]